jgi:DNA modification methylase
MRDQIIHGDCAEVLKKLESSSVNCVITSPPYFGLRDYGTAKWVGGDEDCDHTTSRSRGDDVKATDKQATSKGSRPNTQTKCKSCGAVRVDKQIGLEETPEAYVASMVELFREIRRVLKSDGSVWLNIGDSYYNHRPGKGQSLSKQTISRTKQDLPDVCARRGNKLEGLKEKDLIGIPWRLAFALQADGWYLRQDIIWHKPNPMPESVKDRCTKAHEYIFLLTKGSKYYFDQESIKELSLSTTPKDLVPAEWGVGEDPGTARKSRKDFKKTQGGGGTGFEGHSGNMRADGTTYITRIKRSVWSVSAKPFKDAHFATFPEELIYPMVLAGCPEGGVILDPFMGAGTTALVAKNNGRHYLGIELNPEYIKMAQARLETKQLSLIK